MSDSGLILAKQCYYGNGAEESVYNAGERITLHTCTPATPNSVNETLNDCGNYPLTTKTTLFLPGLRPVARVLNPYPDSWSTIPMRQFTAG
jgi:hypothetical protein